MKIPTPRVRSAQTPKNPHSRRYLKPYYYFRIFVSLSVCFLSIPRTWQDGFDLSLIFPIQKVLHMSILEPCRRPSAAVLTQRTTCMFTHTIAILQTESERVKLRSASDPLDVGVGDPEKPNWQRSMKKQRDRITNASLKWMCNQLCSIRALPLHV